MAEPRATNTCHACGGELSRERGTGGLCPGCLMELGFESPGPVELDEGLDETETLAYRPEALAQGQVLGNRYRIRALLGRGGMGEVWRAVDLKLRVEVALKSLHSRLLSDERALETLRQEVRMAREVVSPNVCRVFDLVELEGKELVSMEYIDGITLWEILRARAPLPLSEAREIAAQFLAGLEAIHEAGLVHRDVKPENLMMTRSGRVVLMDFGIAKGLAEGSTGTISGTPAYMAPEQGRGEGDARADVFSAGVVLAEMIAPGGLATLEARQVVWQAIHSEPPELPESPWASVLEKAAAHHPEHRFPTAAALARALEEVTLRVERAEEVTPYPGLASFTQDDADYFFGRELEVEEMWKKLRRPHLLGLIGPSGAGKSSFLRAGLLAVTPTGWRAVVTTPGTQPFLALARVLATEMAGDEQAVQDLLEFEDPEVAVGLVSRWRQQHDQVLIVVDQFEELFTLNLPEVQERFAALVARLALEADAHVLLAMRDDFLFHCHSYEDLLPILSELTLLGAPKGTALRRALVQPALKCGYRFADDSLVDEMVAEVATERGALPMLAFAAARLWEHRDRDEGLLTREAYEHVGGVGGALAQHAEATLEKIGQDHVPIVRELFRNLVTAQGTRAARTRDELLSVFEGNGRAGGPSGPQDPRTSGPHISAAAVLDTLIDARLLTSYELPAEDDDGSPQQRIEIIHESLLANWPRLVRWQAQDEEGVILRDQLRQAAQMWEERGYPEDLLWTGTSYNEYQLWRERYAGGLTTAEEAFSGAMTVKAERRKRQRRLAIAGAFAVLLAVLAVVGSFWRQSVTQALRAEANQLLALGRLEIEDNPTGALAYAIASLERADEHVTRLFALEALWREPPALILDLDDTGLRPGGVWSPIFSPDGRWLVALSPDSEEEDLRAANFKLWPSSGGEPRRIDTSEDLSGPFGLEFGTDPNLVVTKSWPSHKIQIWSLPEGRLVRTLPTQGPVDFRLASDPERIVTFSQHGSRIRVESWSWRGGDPQLHGEFEDPGGLVNSAAGPWAWSLTLDRGGTRFFYSPPRPSGATDWEIYSLPTEGVSRASPRLVLRHSELDSFIFHPDGRTVAAVDAEEVVHLWDLESAAELAQRRQHGPPGTSWDLRFDPTGARLGLSTYGAHGGVLITVWDLEAPPDAAPTILHGASFDASLAFHPQGEWIAAAGTVRPLAHPLPLDLHGHREWVSHLTFLPDGESLASTSEDGTLRLWPLSATKGQGSRVLFDTLEAAWLNWVHPSPQGRNLLLGVPNGEIWLVPVDESAPRLLGSLGRRSGGGALTSTTAAVCRGDELRIWDLATGVEQTLAAGGAEDRPPCAVVFAPDGRLISTDRVHGIRVWNLADGTRETISERFGSIDLSSDGRFLLAQNQVGEAPSLLDFETDTWTHLAGHGSSGCAALDPTGTIAATMEDGSKWLQVGPASAAPPHLLIGSEGTGCPVISPDGRWIAAPYGNGLIRLWPMPDMSQPPLHTLPYEDLLAKLRTLTNLRVVRDPDSETGWGWDLDPFPGWEHVPTR